VKTKLPVIGLFLTALFATHAHAQQVPPFINGGGVGIFDPEISVVNSGVILDAQPVVSHDRRYVTINMRPTNTRLLALQSYAVNSPFTSAPLGFVGGANPFGTMLPTQSSGRASKSNLTPSVRTSPEKIRAQTSGVLDRRGMTRLSN